mmetsp:Transcript_71396/g.212996  ORF Transcript_71396/g.212996 Transcript_71396/m.212996 type:complete len:215 (-) Transcript_71396:65-709(-)
MHETGKVTADTLPTGLGSARPSKELPPKTEAAGRGGGAAEAASRPHVLQIVSARIGWVRWRRQTRALSATCFCRSLRCKLRRLVLIRRTSGQRTTELLARRKQNSASQGKVPCCDKLLYKALPLPCNLNQPAIRSLSTCGSLSARLARGLPHGWGEVGNHGPDGAPPGSASARTPPGSSLDPTSPDASRGAVRQCRGALHRTAAAAAALPQRRL